MQISVCTYQQQFGTQRQQSTSQNTHTTSESFLPKEALQGQQSKQKLPRVRIPQQQEEMQMNRTSQNPLPC